MFTFNIHGQADDLSLLEPLVRHLGHVEIAIDYESEAIDDANVRDQRTAPRAIHPAVKMIDRIEHERKRKQLERDRQRVESPRVIDAVACPTCHATVGQSCRSTTGKKITFGRTGHTHFERRMAYKAVAS